MPLGKDRVPLQAVVHVDIERKIAALSERLGIKKAAVVALAVSELSNAYGIVLEDDTIDPRQTSLFGEGEVAA